MAHLTDIPVTVAPAAGPRDTSDWSGLPAEERVPPLGVPVRPET